MADASSTSTVAGRMMLSAHAAHELAIVSEGERIGAHVAQADVVADGLSYLLFASEGCRHFYAERQTAGSILEGIRVETGEHHAILPEHVAAPARFVPQRGWLSNDRALSDRLEETERTLRLGARDWKWCLTPTGGKAYLRAEWCAELRPTAIGTHVIMRGLQTFGAHHVGLPLFGELLRTLRPLLSAPSGTTERHPSASVHGAAAWHFLVEQPWPATPVPVEQRRLTALLSPMACDELAVGAPTGKHAKMVAAALPPSGLSGEIVAVLGQPGVLFFAAKHVAVLTTTHVHLHCEGGRATFPWTALTAAVAITDIEIVVTTTTLGRLPLPPCRCARPLASALQSLVTCR